MKKRGLLLALLPDKQDRPAYLEAAQGFAPLCDGYLLSENSHPHVTLGSFSSDLNIEEIWASVQTWNFTSCPIRMLGVMLKKGTTPPHHYSVAVAIAREAPLLDLHYRIVTLLNQFGITPLNPSLELYQPHLTLAGICWEPSAIVTLPPIIGDLLSRPPALFRLALGDGDHIGQYLKTLKQ